MKVARPVRRAGRRNPPIDKMGRALRPDPYIMGAFNRSAIVTVVERRSRFLLLGELPDGHDAQSVYDCLLGLVAVSYTHLTLPTIYSV